MCTAAQGAQRQPNTAIDAAALGQLVGQAPLGWPSSASTVALLDGGRIGGRVEQGGVGEPGGGLAQGGGWRLGEVMRLSDIRL